MKLQAPIVAKKGDVLGQIHISVTLYRSQRQTEGKKLKRGSLRDRKRMEGEESGGERKEDCFNRRRAREKEISRRAAKTLTKP
eukprot:1320599-Amorphochlora_amoeboformis.AAC.1